MAAREPPTAAGWSRRAVLGRLGAAVTALGAAAGTATAQEEGITTKAVILAPDRYHRDDLRGFFLHVDPETDPTQAQVADQCEWAPWNPPESMVYDAQLIDRKGEDHSSEANQLYVSDERSVTPGSLYVINGLGQCGAGYVGFEIEQIAAKGVRSGPATVAGGDETGVSAPGFGVGTGLLGLLGAGLAQRLRGRDGDESATHR